MYGGRGAGERREWGRSGGAGKQGVTRPEQLKDVAAATWVDGSQVRPRCCPPPCRLLQAFACLVRLHEAMAAGAAGATGPDAEQQPDLEAVEEYRWRMHLSRTDLPYAALQVGMRGWEGWPGRDVQGPGCSCGREAGGGRMVGARRAAALVAVGGGAGGCMA